MVFKTTTIFLVAVVGELAGAYAIWRWRRLGGSAWLIGVGAGALLIYALVQTYQPESSFSRLYAAYAGVFLIGAMTWGWLIDGTTALASQDFPVRVGPPRITTLPRANHQETAPPAPPSPDVVFPGIPLPTYASPR